MKPFILVLLFALMLPAMAQGQNISGKVCYLTDSLPVEYATVRLVQNDSVVIAVCLTDEAGYFILPVSESATHLEISSIGCKSRRVPLPCDSVIYLESSNELAEVVVRGSKRYVNPTSRGIIVSMSGNPVAKLGSAAEALKQMPMIDASGGGISVLGFGSPLIYINNRLVRDSGELALLSADDITTVEIVTNPSGKYGSDVTSVILIRTRKLNTGFHSVASGNVSASEEWSESGDVSVNYHTNTGFTFMGDFSYGFSGFRQKRYYGERFYPMDDAETVYITDTHAKARSRSQSMTADAGINYDFGKNSVGVKYTFDRTPKSRYCGNAISITNTRDVDGIASQSNLFKKSSMHHLNSFADLSLPLAIGLRIDADYVATGRKSDSKVDEVQLSNFMTNTNNSHGTLWAGKLTLTRKVNNVEVELGTDLSYTKTTQDYKGFSSDNLDFLKPETDNVRQNLFAGYAGFDWSPSLKWNIYGGIRLESTHVDYNRNGEKRQDLSKAYTYLMPNIGIAFNSPVRLTLYYRSSVSRPSYQSLDNTYLYVTPTLWETGNPELLPTLRHRIGLNVYYRKFMLQSTFALNKRSISTTYGYNGTEGINVTQPINLPTFHSVQIVAVQQFDISFWHPSLQGVFYVQNLKYGYPCRKYNKPLYTIAFNSRFDILGKIYAYLNIFRLGTGNQDLVYSNGSWQIAVTLNRTWKNWTFTLSANDILNTWRQRFDTTTNTVEYSSVRAGASRSISLNVRYSLNSAKGRYKGKISRQDEIDRL
ncbi:MAG: outer membrane beta-barrel protein [Paramuribaculum sp.]|nr:outer membrane beta-barrel protein [Paramuribaculum sp.]